MSNFLLQRISSGDESTLGVLFGLSPSPKFLCFTLEDQYQAQKVYGETRIPAGLYSLRLKTSGRLHTRYARRFPDMHVGMIEIVGIPNFTGVCLHIGNDHDDSEGCPLLGNTLEQNVTKQGFLGDSTNAYRRVYPILRDTMKVGSTSLLVVDFDGNETR